MASSVKKKTFVIIPNLSTHTNSVQTVEVRYLSYKKLCSWAYTSRSIHPLTSLTEKIRLLHEQGYTVAEVQEPEEVSGSMSHAV